MRADVPKVLGAVKVVLIAGHRSLVLQLARTAQQQRSGAGRSGRSTPAAAAAAAQRHARLIEAAAVQQDVMKVAMCHVALSSKATGQLAATFGAAVAPAQLLLPWLHAIAQVYPQAAEHGITRKLGDSHVIVLLVRAWSANKCKRSCVRPDPLPTPATPCSCDAAPLRTPTTASCCC